MRLDRLDHLGRNRAHLACGTKGAVLHMPPRAARNLRQFLGIQRAHPPPIKFARGGKGDVFDVQIKAHANCIGRHQIIHLAVLIQRHLCIARARA